MSAVKEAASQQSQAEQPAWDWPHRVPSQPAQRMLDVHAIRVLEQSHLDFREDFQNLALRRAIPELEERRHKAHARHFIGEPRRAHDLEGRGMGGRRARIILQAIVDVEQAHGHAAPPQQ